MVNGYVNVPSELENLGTFQAPSTIPGIYDKMILIRNLRKPIVGHFNLAPLQNASSVFFPICTITPNKEVSLGFTFGNVVVSLIINKDDEVSLEV